MKKVKAALEQIRNFSYYLIRLNLNENFEFQNVIFEDEIDADLLADNPHGKILRNDDFTYIYFKKYKDTQNVFSKLENIKLIVNERDEYNFEFKNHIWTLIHLENVKNEMPDKNQIIID